MKAEIWKAEIQKLNAESQTQKAESLLDSIKPHLTPHNLSYSSNNCQMKSQTSVTN